MWGGRELRQGIGVLTDGVFLPSHADDHAHPLLPYLLTPIAHCNQAHHHICIVVKQVFGQLKMYFQCLHPTGGCIMMGPEKVAAQCGPEV